MCIKLNRSSHDTKSYPIVRVRFVRPSKSSFVKSFVKIARRFDLRKCMNDFDYLLKRLLGHSGEIASTLPVERK